jgi:ribose transport system substrate-binding protein
MRPIPWLLSKVFLYLWVLIGATFSYAVHADDESNLASPLAASPKIVYIASDLAIPFWKIMASGVAKNAGELGYGFEAYDAKNSVRNELIHTVKAINEHVAGIIISPQTSSSCAMVLKLAKQAGIPVVIADIGTDDGEYVSYISSNNWQGAYDIGQVLVSNLNQRGWRNGKVGIIAIPQKRLNGQLRTSGFMKALTESGIESVDIRQMRTFSQEETYLYAVDLIKRYPDLRAIWIQTSHTVGAALRAINDLGKSDDIALISFDAEPGFIGLIRDNVILGSAMQQPYLMGQEALTVLSLYLEGKPLEKKIQLPILIISKENVVAKSSLIKRTVLGLDESE